MYLFFDTETTGLPLNWNAPAKDADNWPRMVQAAWILHDDDGNELSNESYIIQPDGFIIPEDASRLHGITTQKALNEGRQLAEVLQELGKMIAAADTLVGHNIDFDEKVIAAEFLRQGMENYLAKKNKVCTMKSGTEYCAIASQYGYKWPKLSELHYHLFQTVFADAHNAAADIKITAKCFWEMKRRGILR